MPLRDAQPPRGIGANGKRKCAARRYEWYGENRPSKVTAVPPAQPESTMGRGGLAVPGERSRGEHPESFKLLPRRHHNHHQTSRSYRYRYRVPSPCTFKSLPGCAFLGNFRCFTRQIHSIPKALRPRTAAAGFNSFLPHQPISIYIFFLDSRSSSKSLSEGERTAFRPYWAICSVGDKERQRVRLGLGVFGGGGLKKKESMEKCDAVPAAPELLLLASFTYFAIYPFSAVLLASTHPLPFSPSHPSTVSKP